MNTNRRLAAILVADVVGYSRMMEADEVATLAALKDRRKNILEPVVKANGGRIVKLMGDGVLVEFGSAVKAVEGAIELQKRMAAANESVDEAKRVVLRIGLNLGDVLGEGSDIYGEGVNIAARLESLAEPGEIYISSKVQQEVAGKVQAELSDMGEQALKNVEKTVRVFRIGVHSNVSAAVPARPASAKPSVAVLPFTNMSGDAEQNYFSDGITEDIITELSRFRSLLVIARNSSFQYRAGNFDLRKVGRELGVQYVVEGSVRRAGEKIRVTAQLIDTVGGDHVWADRYDRGIEDVFAVQDEVARTIASTLEGRVAAATSDKVKRKPTGDWRAYDYFLQAREMDEKYEVDGAEKLYTKAVELDPAYAQAHACRAMVLAVMNLENTRADKLDGAWASAQKALSLDPHDATVQHAVGYVALCQNKFELAGLHLERALRLNPNDLRIAADHSSWLSRTGRPDEALRRLDAAMERDPFSPAWLWEVRFRALFHLGRFEEAIAAIDHVSVDIPWLEIYKAAANAHAGRAKEAQAAVERLLEAMPACSINLVEQIEPYGSETYRGQLLEGLRKAGLPE